MTLWGNLMVRRACRGLMLAICAIVLAACSGEVQPTAVPFTSTPQPSATPQPTLPDAPTPTELLRATLPPTWTPIFSPTPVPSATPSPVPTFDMVNAMLLTSPTLQACSMFSIDLARTATTVDRTGNNRVTWMPVDGAVAYRVALYSEELVTLFATIVGETHFDFGGSLFQPLQSYFWEVRPLDRSGAQLCAAIGAVLIPIN